MLMPDREEALAELVREGQPLAIQGGGTRRFGPAIAGRPLSTRAISGIVSYDPGALSLVVRAGTPMAEVEAVLASERQMLPFEPMDHRVLLGTRDASGPPTIGGAVATNASGPRRISAGACRDAVLGVRFVNGLGEVIKSGGRVMKNVTGLDLARFLTGSHGTLGIITEISFKLLPLPEAEATLVVPGGDVGLLCAAMGTAAEVSGAAIVDGAALLRLEGFADSIPGRLRLLRDALRADGLVLETAASRARWAAVRDVTPLAGLPGRLWRISLRPTDAPRLLAACPGPHVLDWSGGLIWLRTNADPRIALAALGGHATLMQGEGRVFHPEPPALAAISARLKAAFDPHGLLNPGRMGA